MKYKNNNGMVTYNDSETGEFWFINIIIPDDSTDYVNTHNVL